jgi:hypothetical protein
MTDSKGLFRRVLEAMIEGRRRRVERRMKDYLARLGLEAPNRD